MNIKKGDTVIMLSGKDRGKVGLVLRADPNERKIVVQGLNLVKRHLRPKAGGKQGQIVSIERWIHAAAVAVVHKDTRKATRIGWQVGTDGTKTRVDRKTGTPLV